MDWLRRNWPDLLIGVALVAVIAGIIATLITGGSFFPVGQSTRTGTQPAQNATTQSVAPQSPSSPSTSSTSSNATSASTSANQSAPAAQNGKQAATNGGPQSTTSAAAPANGGVSVLPPGASTSPNGAAASTSSAATSPSPPAAATPGASTSSSTPAAAANGPGAAAPYRISVGAFSHKAYAQRQEETFKKAGYPVFLASQGDLTIVLVGPYKNQSQAEQVAGKIKNGGFGVDPVVYQFQGTSDQAPQPAGGTTQSATSGAAAPAASTSSSSTAAATTSGQRFLQVGAYGSSASAKPQRDRLEKMGFTVQERTENGLVKLLIGPFGPDRLTQVQSQLKSAGIDSFPR